MSGHSHWASIRHKKATVDARKGKERSRLLKAVMAAARIGGADPKSNLRLASALEKAKQANVPKDNIEKSILRATGQLPGVNLEQITYEGYGPGGAAVLVEALTDNRNRTTPELRKAFEKHGGNLGSNGCVAWLFSPKGLVVLSAPGKSEDEMMDLALDAGAEDISGGEGSFELTCSREDFDGVREYVSDQELDIESAEVTLVPSSYVDLNAEDGRKVVALMEELEDHEDVQNVHSNFNLPAELVEEMGRYP